VRLGDKRKDREKKNQTYKRGYQVWGWGVDTADVGGSHKEGEEKRGRGKGKRSGRGGRKGGQWGVNGRNKRMNGEARGVREGGGCTVGGKAGEVKLKMG